MATLKNTVIDDTGYITLPVGTTAQRPASPTVGMVRYNTTLGFSEQYTADGWQGISPPPVITSISPTSFNGESGTTITVNGANFDTSATVQFILTGGAVVNSSSTTRSSSSLLTATTPRDFLASESPATVKVANGSGLSATIEGVLTFAAGISFNTASGSIGTIYDGSRSTVSQLSSLAATDAQSGTIDSYSIVSGALPTGLSLNSSTAALSGTASAVGSDTTYSFTVRATDNAGNTLDRAFTITVRAPVVVSFTATGATSFSVPTGVSNARVVVVAAGGQGGPRNGGPGGGSDGGAGGGAGGMIDIPSYPLTPGGSVPVTVGAGSGPNTTSTYGVNGGDSIFGALTAKGGGGGGAGPGGPVADGQPGGSGGGRGGGGSPNTGIYGSGIQPSQPGSSGTYGYGNPGGANPNVAPYTGAGGGGAGGAGSNGGNGNLGYGGNGRATDISGSSVTYAGGGGGGGGGPSPTPGANGGSGGGGNGGTSPANGPTDATSGSTNTGGGGGGGTGSPFNPSGGSGTAGGGGPGIVIVKY